MITIEILGLDQYVIGHYSKDHTSNLANLYETSEENINFYAPCDSLLFHQGVEQTSWETIIFVKAPEKYSRFEEIVAKYLLKTLGEFSIHLEINFEYIPEGKTYVQINPDYPRYLTDKNVVHVHEEEEMDMDDSDEDDADPRDRADLDPNDPNQLYLGDVFAGHQDELDDRQEKVQESLDHHIKH